MENQGDREPFSRSPIGKYSHGNGSWRGVRIKHGNINQNLINIFENQWNILVFTSFLMNASNSWWTHHKYLLVNEWVVAEQMIHLRTLCWVCLTPENACSWDNTHKFRGCTEWHSMQVIFTSMDVFEEIRKQWPWWSHIRSSWGSRYLMAAGTCQLAEVRGVWWFKVKSLSHATLEAWKPNTCDGRP